MKIVIATSRPFHLIHLSRELANLGHEVLAYGYIPRSRISHYKPGKSKYKSLFIRFLPYTAMALQGRWSSLQKFSTEYLFNSVDDYISENMPDCDVFIGLSGVICNSFNIAKERFGAVTICDRGSSHVLSQKAILENIDTARLSENYVQRELNGYSSADYVAVPSVYAERTFIEQGFDTRRLFVNNYGVDLSRFNPGSHKEINTKTRLLFIGGWNYRKGVDIFAEVLAADSNLQLTHIGMPGDIDFPESPQFTTLGPLPNDRLAEYYRSHDIFVLPSREDGFGMVLLEAMACGLPVIASVNTGAPDITLAGASSKSVVLLQDIRAESLLAAIRAMVGHINNRTEPVLRLKEQTHFTWEEYGRRYSEFLRKVVALRGM